MKNKCDSIFDKKQIFIIKKFNSKEHSLVQLKKKTTTTIKDLRKSTTFVKVTTVGNLKTMRFKAA